MRPKLLWLLALVLCVHLTGMAQQAKTYSATFRNASPVIALQILKKSTGCDFVYQKELIQNNKASVSGTFKNLPLDELLEATIDQQLGLAYKIVGTTVSLSEPDKASYAYDAMVTGTVTDEAGEPLAGTTVMLKGTRYGVSADIDGKFSIMIHHTDPSLEFSYVGMHPKTIRLTTKNIGMPLHVVLETNASTMDEVVVTGYQNIKRENATGAYTIISGDELNKRHNADVTSSLEGNIPGLVMKRERYTEGEDALVIRGVGTFEASSAPLIVVDGLPIEGGLESVNNYDIQNITVLKDASAAAIYGARASNGVIVISTKQADREKLQVDFNADLSITGRKDYSKAGWASAAQLIQLERLNWNAMLAEPDQSALQSLLSSYNLGRLSGIFPVSRLLIDNYLGGISEADMNATLNSWAGNDYRSEWQDLRERSQISQQYNLSLRTRGKILASSITLNYTTDNMGLKKENSNALQFRYKGDLKAAKWLDLSFSVNVIHSRTKGIPYSSYDEINSFRPYQSMYNADGSLARMEADIPLSTEAFSNPDYELKDHSFNLAEETGLLKSKTRNTNIRAYVHALFHLPIQGWTATAMYQHEDINYDRETEYFSGSYYARNIYNLYTTVDSKEVWVDDPNWSFDDWDGDFDHVYKKKETQDVTVHHVPYGGILSTGNSHSTYYTFRAQTDFSRTFGRHDISALAGFEYRQNRTESRSNTYLGYDHQTMTNQNLQTDWEFINGWGKTGVLGPEYGVYGCPSDFSVSETLHRYYSYYFTASYVYDTRYSVFGSYRVDKTDLFGTDPKFRGRPLWSVGGSWNAHNEAFLRTLPWLDALKLRISYGLTGNIKTNATSYLTAEMETNNLNGGLQADIQTPPNDQLRWEKTSTWNWGLDFAFFGYRLNGSVDAYRRYGSDLLTDVALDVTTGWPEQMINAGEMLNTGVEFQLNGRILPARSRKDLGISLGMTFGYNHNKVTKVYYHPHTGSEFRSMTLKQGYPLNSCVMVDYAGLQTIDGIVYGTWRDHNGEVHNTSLSSDSFTMEDCRYMGTYTPVWTGGITPEITWNGFSLSAMIHYYGGHVMSINDKVYSTIYGSSGGYEGNTPASALDYWNGVEGAIPNGYMTKYVNLNTIGIGASDYRNYKRADYMKLRSITLSYEFERKLIKRIGLSDLRLRFQIDNVATWARNSRGWDPEASRPTNGLPIPTPRTYTMSLYLNL